MRWGEGEKGCIMFIAAELDFFVAAEKGLASSLID